MIAFLNKSKPKDHLAIGFIAIAVLCILVAVKYESFIPALVPLVFWIIWLSIFNVRLIFLLMLASIPISAEVRFVNAGLGTDVPVEMLVVGLAMITAVWLLVKPHKFSAGFFTHPISLLVGFHFAWILVASFFSLEWFVSAKFALAKAWYILSFFILAGYFIKDEKSFRSFCNVIFYVLLFAVVITLIRHAAYGFSFADVNQVMRPFFRNHVSYAAIMAILFPIIALSRYWYPKGSYQRWAITGFTLLFFIAIYLSYTRTAYIAIMLAGAASLVMHFKLVRHALAMAIIGSIAGIIFLSVNNKYLDYAPDYTRTITHKSFDNLLEATYKGEDISTMERVHRWVAGAFMFQEYPITGFGPNNFYPYYKSYTVRSFETYVSDNPEQSGIHSYYMMVLVEQGVPGFIIFLILVIASLLYGERIYHQTTNKHRKLAVLMVFSGLVVIYGYNIINDMLETDKVGSFYFLFLAALVKMDMLNRLEAGKNAIPNQNQ